MRYCTHLVGSGFPFAFNIVNQYVFRYAHLYVCLTASLYGSWAQANLSFDPAFLSNSASKIADLSRFETTDSILPGNYPVDVYLNGVFIESRDVLFDINERSGNSSELAACFTPEEVLSFNINPAAVPGLGNVLPGACVQLESLITNAKSTLDLARLRVDLNVPQAVLTTVARGFVPIEEWDDGVNALLVNYNFSGAHITGSKVGASDSYFLNFNSGLNMGAWRLRNYSTVSDGNRYTSGQGMTWKTINSYAQRALPGTKSRLVVGQTSTSSNVFNNFSFQGVQMSSDENMLADSERGFAPVVRGIANSNAEVTIRQSGNVIYQTYVPAGPFIISDIYPTSSNGDLQVIVVEADGRVNQYSVPFSSLPILQREGQFKYDLVAGTLRNTSYQTRPSIIQGTLAWGLPLGLTLYGGGQNAAKYQAYSIGVGQNLGHWGALSLDMTAAKSILPDYSKHTGYSFRMLYAKTLLSTGTNFKLAGYQYTTRGFYNFSDTASKMMEQRPAVITSEGEILAKPEFNDYFNLNYPKRSSAQLNIAQPLGSIGSLYMSGNRQTFWNTGEVTDLLQAGYQTTIKGINYSLSYSYNKSAWIDKADQMIALNISMPLDEWISSGRGGRSSNHMYASYGQTVSDDGHARYNAGVSGSALENSNLSYSIQQSYTDSNHVASSNLATSYRGASANVNAGYNHSGNNRRLNYGVSGGIVAHEDGITFSQPLGDTNILIKAPNAKDVKVSNGVGIKTNQRGYAVVPSASTYRENRVALDTNTLANNVELDNAIVSVVPTQGALVRANFGVRVGVRALMNLSYKGQPIPFGASVTQTANLQDSIVGNNGQVFLSGLAPKGLLHVRWQEGPEGQCTVHYELDDESEFKDISKLAAECV